MQTALVDKANSLGWQGKLPCEQISTRNQNPSWTNYQVGIPPWLHPIQSFPFKSIEIPFQDKIKAKVSPSIPFDWTEGELNGDPCQRSDTFRANSEAPTNSRSVRTEHEKKKLSWLMNFERERKEGRGNKSENNLPRVYVRNELHDD